jgi:hypothetical protein
MWPDKDQASPPCPPCSTSNISKLRALGTLAIGSLTFLCNPMTKPRSQQKKGAVPVDCVHRNHCLCWKSELPVAWKESCLNSCSSELRSHSWHAMALWCADFWPRNMPRLLQWTCKGNFWSERLSAGFCWNQKRVLISWRNQVSDRHWFHTQCQRSSMEFDGLADRRGWVLIWLRLKWGKSEIGISRGKCWGLDWGYEILRHTHLVESFCLAEADASQRSKRQGLD